MEQWIVVRNYDAWYTDKIDIPWTELSIMLIKQYKDQTRQNPAFTCPKLSFRLDNICNRAHSGAAMPSFNQ